MLDGLGCYDFPSLIPHGRIYDRSSDVFSTTLQFVSSLQPTDEHSSGFRLVVMF